MALRFVVISLCIALIALVVTQLIYPALLNQPLFGMFRAENRLDRARRLKTEAAARKLATQLESDALKLGMEEKKIREEAFTNATRGGKA